MRGLRTKTAKFRISVSEDEFDVIGLVETWLSGEISSAEYFPDSYNVFRNDRDFIETGRSRGGGVLLAFKNSFNVIRIELGDLFNILPLIDVVGCNCILKNVLFYVFCIYIPPGTTLDEFELFFGLFDQFNYCHENVLILGDFNAPLFVGPVVGDVRSRILNEFMMFNDLKQINTVLNCNERLLDLVFTGVPGEVMRDDGPFVAEDGHHPALNISLSLFAHTSMQSHTSGDYRAYNFRRANFPALYNALLEVDWNFLTSYADVEVACGEFYRVLYGVFDLHVPLFKSIKRKYPPWFTREIISNIKLKNKYFNKFKKFKREEDREHYRRLRSLTKTQVGCAYRTYIIGIQQNISNNPREFWSFIHSIKGSSRIPGIVYHADIAYDDPQAIVNAFSQYFSTVYADSNPNVSLSGECTYIYY